MPLNWLVDNKVADESTYRPPKDVTLEATGLSSSPTTFEIFRSHESAFRQIMRHVGIPELTPASQINAVMAAGGRYRSERDWSLPVPRGALRKSAAFVFLVNSSDERSGTIYSSRKARAQVSKKQSAKLKAPVPKAPVSAELGFEREIDIEVTYAVDPDMEIQVLTGSELASYALKIVAEEAGIDPDIQTRIAFQLDRLSEELPATYSPPGDWVLNVPTSVHGEEGVTSTITSRISASSVGLGYFALALSDPDAPSDDEVSDIFAVEVVEDENGRSLNIIADFDSMPLPLYDYV